jgi:hypothetical protein
MKTVKNRQRSKSENEDIKMPFLTLCHSDATTRQNKFAI